ncbi:MAG: hypothetical protein U1E63_01890 [Burkholderiales bacterium]
MRAVVVPFRRRWRQMENLVRDSAKPAEMGAAVVAGDRLADAPGAQQARCSRRCTSP